MIADIRTGCGLGLLAWLGICLPQAASGEPAKAYGLTSRPAAKPYLLLPETASGSLPALLSQTGAFNNTRDLIPSESLIPYDLNVAFWSDGASKSRWISIPSGPTNAQITFSPTGEWNFPNGTVLVKHFEIATNEERPDLKRRLETRFIVREASGKVYGATYKWRADNSDADLLASNLSETLLITTTTGTRTQNWYYPSRQDCRTCHTDTAGGVLGLKTRQLNRDFTYPNGTTDNQLRAWNHVGLFRPEPSEADLAHYARLAPANDATRTLEDRARSYLDANCAHCHRPGGTVLDFDTRYDTPLEKQKLVDGPVLLDEGLDRARIIAPNDIWRSIAFLRVSATDALKMPPLAHEKLDREAVTLLRQWIESLPGPRVLPPPAFSRPGGNYRDPIEVALSHPEPGAVIHFTTDGSAPTSSDPPYEKPLKLSEPTVLRAKAFKPGFTRSITVQQVFVIGE
ncbi:MAG TPA: chitobiase/beta-hexosaminidase C-terminal domain-containing protein [Candidatus Binatia bacterium]|jgi:uncharacterized repeat protein (TIGR03806 family)|nr:chitobiase/beta-hexosaminidase C-terminal domain-containing protein [Candidatus Binatia bacterium]